MGEIVQCERKGRRLCDADAEVLRVLPPGLAQAQDWHVQHFEGDVDLWRESQGVVRSTHALAKEKMGFIGKIPYLLASLQKPGVRAACIAQFESIEPSGHHRVTRWFLDPGHPETLRHEVDQMHAVMSLTWCPMGDCV